MSCPPDVGLASDIEQALRPSGKIKEAGRNAKRPRSKFRLMETIVACRTCGLVQRLDELGPGTVAECARCGWRLTDHRVNSLGRTAAFTLAALLLYVPANIYPILKMDLYGAHSENTVWEGAMTLFRRGETLVALVVFLASIVIPFLKLLGLFALVVTARFRSKRARAQRTFVYRAIEVIGPWAMLDVFLLAILVALVKLGELATVVPGPGLFAFTAVVVLTILASASFDPTLIWEPDGSASRSAEGGRAAGRPTREASLLSDARGESAK